MPPIKLVCHWIGILRSYRLRTVRCRRIKKDTSGRADNFIITCIDGKNKNIIIPLSF